MLHSQRKHIAYLSNRTGHSCLNSIKHFDSFMDFKLFGATKGIISQFILFILETSSLLETKQKADIILILSTYKAHNAFSEHHYKLYWRIAQLSFFIL